MAARLSFPLRARAAFHAELRAVNAVFIADAKASIADDKLCVKTSEAAPKQATSTVPCVEVEVGAGGGTVPLVDEVV